MLKDPNGILQDAQTTRNHIRGDIRRGKYRVNRKAVPATDPAAATSKKVPLPNNSKGKGKAKPRSEVATPAAVPLATTSSAGGIPIHPVAQPRSTTP